MTQQMDTASDSESDDEVEHEIDVYLSKRLQGKLYLLQYPVKKNQKPFGPHDRKGAKIKPVNNKLEMDVSLNISSPSYDQSKGEQIALNVDGNDAALQSSTVFDTNVMDKQSLQSIAVPTSGKRYVCGVIHDNDLHLTPISHVLQLRPSFKYMDQAEHRAVRIAKMKEAAEADSSQDETDDAKAVTLRIKGAETEAARLARERSYAAYEKRLAEERWCSLKFYSSENGVVELEKRKLLCQQTMSADSMMGQSVPEVRRTPRDYLDSLKPVYTQHGVDETAMPENVLSVSLLKHESLGDQIKLIMRNAKIIKFSHLLSLLHGASDSNTVVRSLQSYAVLIRGCWIVKSDVIFPAETVSPLSGTPAESLCRSRDFILFMFTIREFLSRKETTATVKIPGDDVKAILDDIAVMRVGKGWRLRLDPDYEFSVRFPEVAERQGMIWSAMGAKLAKVMDMPNLLTDAVTVASKKPEVSPSRKKKIMSPGGDKNTSKSTKTVKKQRKNSGTAASAQNIKPKSEPQSPTRMQLPKTEPVSAASAPPMPFVQLNGASSSNGNVPTPTTSCISGTALNGTVPFTATLVSSGVENPPVIPPLSSMPAGINIDSVNSTVQCIANQIYMSNSPNRLQHLIPDHEVTVPSSQVDGNFYVKREKDH